MATTEEMLKAICDENRKELSAARQKAEMAMKQIQVLERAALIVSRYKCEQCPDRKDTISGELEDACRNCDR